MQVRPFRAIAVIIITLAAPASIASAADTPPVYEPGQPTHPTELVNPSAENRRLVQDAIEEVTAECMNEAGFDYLPRPDDTVEIVFNPRPADDQLRHYGYQVPAPPDNQAAWDTFNAQGEDPDWQRALAGGPTSELGGCNRTAFLAVYGPDLSTVPPDNNTFVALVAEFTTSELTDPAYTALTADWAACMTAKGHTATDPDTFITQFFTEQRLNNQTGPPGDEIAAALDDYACRDDINWIDRRYGRAQQLTAEFAATNRTLIESMTTWYRKVEQRAHTVLTTNE